MPITDLPVMIFAAGRGTRMAPLTDDTPKPMVSVGGRPLISYALHWIKDAGLSRVFANTHYLPETLEDYLASQGVVTIREPDLLETGGGLRNALPNLGSGPVLVMNSDAIWHGENPIIPLLNTWNPNEMGALLSLTQKENAHGYERQGDFSINEDGQIERAPDLIYNGVHITKTDQLSKIDAPVFSLNCLWELMIEQHSLYGSIYKGGWCDVGHPGSIPTAEALLNESRN